MTGRRILRWAALVMGAFLAIVLAGFLLWAGNTAGPLPEAEAALVTDEEISVQSDPWLTFRPVQAEPGLGLIFYPGGRVDPGAYAPPLRAIAEEGFLVVVPAMPLNLAVLSPDIAEQIITAHPDISTWVIGGHSLGGTMASRFANRNPGLIDGLVLWAAYPASSDALSAASLPILSVYGSRDGLTTPAQIEATRSLLPPQTRWIEITGGNHAQFASYGDQAGDEPASVSRTEQQARTVHATLELLQDVLRSSGSD